MNFFIIQVEEKKKLTIKKLARIPIQSANSPVNKACLVLEILILPKYNANT